MSYCLGLGAMFVVYAALGPPISWMDRGLLFCTGAVLCGFGVVIHDIREALRKAGRL